MKNLLLDDDGDLALVSGNLAFAEGVRFFEQKLKNRLSLFYGEWFLDRGLGVPYLGQVLGKKQLGNTRALLLSEVQKIAGVEEIKKFEVELLPGSRKVKVAFGVVVNGTYIEVEL